MKEYLRIPQGSILGPILFLIYINDLPESCDISSYDVNLYLYAYDAKVYKTIKNSEDNKTLQAAVNKIKDWSDKWLLKLNIGKCKVMQYTMREHIDINEQIILNKINKLDVTKSPGPDGLHPRILYELRNEIAIPLKILYQTSFKLTTLPLDWTSGHIVAIHKKR